MTVISVSDMILQIFKMVVKGKFLWYEDFYINPDLWEKKRRKTMKKSVFFTIVSICCFFMIVTLTRSEDAQKITDVGDLNHRSGKLGNYRALIIGINKYKDKYIPSLTTARKDAEETAKLLEERYGFQTKLLLDDKATQEAVFKALRELAESTEENDSVLIYYAGHGELDTVYNDGWWIPSDAKFGKPLTYLDNTQMQKAIRSMKARHVLLISDSCYSGTLFGQETRAMPPVINERYYLSLYNEKSRWGMTSGNKEPVQDDGTGDHSIFAYQLLKALRENEKPFISTQEIHTRIAPIIGNNSEQTPICKPIRNVGDQGGQFVFVASSGAVVTAPSPKSTVEISCNVSAAKVFLNGTYMGETPLADREILPGGYKLRVEKQGYETYQRDITVEKNRSASFYVDLSEKVITAPVVAPAVSSRESDKKSFTNSIGMTFVYIPPGEFMMGSPENEPGRDSDEKQHKVKLTKGFYMQTTEVTQGQWKAVMGDNPSYFKDCGDDCPAENVSWDDVQEFIKKLNQKEGKTYRLPIEAEWEYACRAGTQTALYTGDIKILGSNNAPALDGIAWYGGNSCVEYSGGYDCSGWTEKQYGCPKCGTHSVGKKKPNSWGLYDMYGNVWEWCHDWYGDYASGSVIDPVGPVSGSSRVFRGGSWYDLAQYCRSAGRHGGSPDFRSYNLGFRPVLLPGQQR